MTDKPFIYIGDVPCIHCGTVRFPLANRYQGNATFQLECKICGTKITTEKWTIWTHSWAIENEAELR